ncbi:MAG: hypothetical protein F9K26_12860 [Ignavibacteriaceae bacterium]|nr:MAG: hypothetical protein F9K26_12860 [Ignavibacteriaceae bacterium]MBW7869275.1 hypothetical protein [Brumimicrobium sp.]
MKKDYEFQTFADYLSESEKKVIIFRHDVDLRPLNALDTAKLEADLGVSGVYNFRIIPETFKPDIIKEIADLGHEIGYHYEDMDLVKADNLDRHIDLAYESFQRNLEKLRKIVPITTICMHGSPRAKYDNKMIWTKYDYRELGIKGEPYLDIDFNEFHYLTDTGRRWNGDKVSVRDKVNSKFNFNLKTTQDVINAIPQFPDKIMITIHPQRWENKLLPWTRELVSQNLKNVVKWLLVKSKR